ncbi:MAG TPA: hypothetical protein VMS56_04055 [Thermoanaerobaculia bacterium]|nr:hypothetical protein [Thermoanaerobaculia bacterium]
MKKTALNVEFFTPEGELVASTVLRPGDDPLVPSGPDAPSSYRFPGFASVLDLRAAFPELNGLPLFHIRLTPAVEGIEYWPMVSVTDDVTQHVLLITAQP